ESQFVSDGFALEHAEPCSNFDLRIIFMYFEINYSSVRFAVMTIIDIQTTADNRKIRETFPQDPNMKCSECLRSESFAVQHFGQAGGGRRTWTINSLNQGHLLPAMIAELCNNMKPSTQFIQCGYIGLLYINIRCSFLIRLLKPNFRTAKRFTWENLMMSYGSPVRPGVILDSLTITGAKKPLNDGSGHKQPNMSYKAIKRRSFSTEAMLPTAGSAVGGNDRHSLISNNFTLAQCRLSFRVVEDVDEWLMGTERLAYATIFSPLSLIFCRSTKTFLDEVSCQLDRKWLYHRVVCPLSQIKLIEFFGTIKIDPRADGAKRRARLKAIIFQLFLACLFYWSRAYHRAVLIPPIFARIMFIICLNFILIGGNCPCPRPEWPTIIAVTIMIVK
ncbi:Hypothetical predicted protein, partial [Paramuricea clavata]